MTSLNNTRRFLLTLLSCAWLSASFSAAAMADDALPPVPHPNLDTLTPEVRRSIAPALEQFEQSKDELSGAELGRLYGKLGLHYQAQQQQIATRASFHNAMVLDPESFQWPYYLAVHYEETGETAQAANLYRKSLELNPNNVAGIVRLGLLMAEAGAPADAEKLLRLAIDADPNNAAAFAGLGAVAGGREDYQQAIQYYNKALELQPEATQLHYRLGLVYRQAGNVDMAKKELALRGPRIPSIDDPLLRLMQAFARPASDYIELGKQALEQGELEKAAGALTLAINIDSENVEALTRLGQTYAALGRGADAVQQFERALAITPDNAAAHFFLGALYEMQGDDGKAVESYSAAERSQPGFSGAQQGLAGALMRQARYLDAAQTYAGLLQNNAENGDLLFWQGMAFMAAGRCAEAEPALLAAFNAIPNAGHIIHAISRLYSICPDVDEAKRKTALAYADLMYTREPGLDTAETFAMAMAANGMFADAQELQAQAMFESAKLQDAQTAAQLRVNLDRYQMNLPAQHAWPAGHAVYSPPPINASTIR